MMLIDLKQCELPVLAIPNQGLTSNSLKKYIHVLNKASQASQDLSGSSLTFLTLLSELNKEKERRHGPALRGDLLLECCLYK